MEAREPPLSASALFTVQSSLSLFLSIFLSLYVLFHRCIGFLSLVNTRDSQLLKTGEEPAQPQKTRSSTTMAAVVDSSLLDSGIEDIPVPILQPKSTDMPVDRTVNEAQSSQGALLDRRLEHLMIPVLEPARKPVSTSRVRQSSSKHTSSISIRKAPKPVPWDGRIRWAVKGCSVFDSQKDETDAYLHTANFLSRQPISNLWVFQYGLRYIPANEETNIYRTVRIEGLSADVTVNHVLSVVPGEIYSSQLFNTAAITGYNTVIVIFVQERDARGLVQRARRGLQVGSSLAKVTMVNTPTYPMPTEMEGLIKKGYSRCLVVSNVSEANQTSLSRILQRSASYPYIERIDAGGATGLVSIQFHSIKSAMVACLLLKGHPNLRESAVGYLKEVDDKLVVSRA